MKSFFAAFLILLPIVAIGQTDSLNCYRAGMADAIIKVDKRAYVFETYDNWAAEGNSASLLEGGFKWVFRDGDGNLLDDAELLAKVGQENAAARMSEMYRVRKKTGKVRLIVGVPLGIAMMAIGGYWLNKNFEDETPSVLDQAGALVLSVAGVGVTAGATMSFIGTRKVDPYDHDITEKQSLDVLDRHNKAVAARCHARK